MINFNRSSLRVLDPNERISEVLFGLIMVLTFTGSLRIALEDRNEIRAMLIGALGCNFAWGIIDGVFYLMNCLSEKSRNRATLLAVRKASDPERAQRLIREELPPIIESLLQSAEVESIRQRLLQLPELPPTYANERERLARRAGGFSAGVPFDVPRGDSVRRDAEYGAGGENFQRHRDGHAVLRGGGVREIRGTIAMVFWNRNGGVGRGAGRVDDGAWRVKPFLGGRESRTGGKHPTTNIQHRTSSGRPAGHSLDIRKFILANAKGRRRSIHALTDFNEDLVGTVEADEAEAGEFEVQGDVGGEGDDHRKASTVRPDSSF